MLKIKLLSFSLLLSIPLSLFGQIEGVRYSFKKYEDKVNSNLPTGPMTMRGEYVFFRLDSNRTLMLATLQGIDAFVEITNSPAGNDTAWALFELDQGRFRRLEQGSYYCSPYFSYSITRSGLESEASIAGASGSVINFFVNPDSNHHQLPFIDTNLPIKSITLDNFMMIYEGTMILAEDKVRLVLNELLSHENECDDSVMRLFGDL